MGLCVGLCALALLAGPAQAAERAGPWCLRALSALRDSGPSHGAHAAVLLGLDGRRAPAAQEAAQEAAPQRIVHVAAGAERRGADGSAARPWPGLQQAVDRARPGDLIRVGPGDYAPVRIAVSGTAQAPITLAAHPVGPGGARIDGTGTRVRGLIALRGASHVTVSGFDLRNAPQDGIFIEGVEGGARGIRVTGNRIDTTGNSAIYAGGIVMRYLSGVDEYRLFDVQIDGNTVTNTNTPNGVNEAITLGGGVDGFAIRDNHVFDTRQYGIDAKAGAINGEISGNIIHGVARHGIYLDAGSRRVANIEVTRNAVFGVRNGIVLARESGRDPAHPNLHDITVSDNLVFDAGKFGIMAYRHRDDSGRGRFADLRIRGNCLCGIGEDAVRLGGIGGFARDVTVAGNLIFASGGGIRDRIGADLRDNDAAPHLACPG